MSRVNSPASWADRSECLSISSEDSVPSSRKRQPRARSIITYSYKEACGDYKNICDRLFDKANRMLELQKEYEYYISQPNPRYNEQRMKDLPMLLVTKYSYLERYPICPIFNCVHYENAAKVKEEWPKWNRASFPHPAIAGPDNRPNPEWKPVRPDEVCGNISRIEEEIDLIQTLLTDRINPLSQDMKKQHVQRLNDLEKALLWVGPCTRQDCIKHHGSKPSTPVPEETIEMDTETLVAHNIRQYC